MSNFVYQDPLPLGPDTTSYRRLEGSEKYVSVEQFAGEDVLRVDPEALKVLARTAMREVSFLLRPEHNEQVAAIFGDPEASENDKLAQPDVQARRDRLAGLADLGAALDPALVAGHAGRPHGRAQRVGQGADHSLPHAILSRSYDAIGSLVLRDKALHTSTIGPSLGRLFPFTTRRPSASAAHGYRRGFT